MCYIKYLSVVRFNGIVLVKLTTSHLDLWTAQLNTIQNDWELHGLVY